MCTTRTLYNHGKPTKVGLGFLFTEASYSVARKLGQSQGIITYAVNCKGASTWIRLVLLVFTCKGFILT